MGPGLPFGLASVPGTLLSSECLCSDGEPGCTGETWVVYADDIVVLPTSGPTRVGTDVAKRSTAADDATEGATVPQRQ